jgi:membrane protein involved in D-alanine export
LYVLLPNVLLGWWNRFARVWIVLGTAFMLTIQYYGIRTILPGTSVLEIWLVLGFGIAEYLVALAFLVIRKHHPNKGLFTLVLLLSLAPLLSAKFIPLAAPTYQLTFIGLSYVTFRCLDVILGIHEGLIQKLPPIQYLVYLLLPIHFVGTYRPI